MGYDKCDIVEVGILSSKSRALKNLFILFWRDVFQPLIIKTATLQNGNFLVLVKSISFVRKEVIVFVFIIYSLKYIISKVAKFF